MAKITIITREGERIPADAQTGMSLMEVIRAAGVDELLALCGGCCSCATCHVHVDSASQKLLPPITPDENDLLDSAPTRDAFSRLSCQLIMSEAYDGITVTVAEED